MSQSSSASPMDLLKEAIRDCHTRIEKLPFIEALTQGHLPIDSYVAQLRAMAVIHGTLDHELSLVSIDEIRTLLLDRPSRLAHLRKDLTATDPLLIPDIAPSVEHTRKITEHIRFHRLEDPIKLLGIIYVLEGMTLGNAVHLPDVRKLLTDQPAAVHYYTGYGDKTDDYWEQFSCVMDTLTASSKYQAKIIDVAQEFIEQLKKLFATFYPLEGANRVFTAGMLNPEAGDHAVPETAAEIKAAVSAAKRCRAEYPYFDERYQERGEGFAKSDAAWLVTLADLPPSLLRGQVEWLGRVLGNRGIPRITLERQLELLHEELRRAGLPTEKYQVLLEAAEGLKNERFRYISEPQFSRLVGEFYLSIDRSMKKRFRGTGELIVSATCDQAAGIDDAIESLIAWLTEPHRFSQQWIRAVDHTLINANKEISSKS